MRDFRTEMFCEMPWYLKLEKPADDTRPSAYWLTKAPYDENRHRWLIEALDWAKQHGLWDEYKTLFSGINIADLNPDRGKAKKRRVTHPIAQIAFEPLAAFLLERAWGWRFLEREAESRGSLRSDWFFETSSKARALVEVKTISDEPELNTRTGSGTKQVKSALLRAIRKFGKSDAPNLAVIGDHLNDYLVNVPEGMDGVVRSFYGDTRFRINQRRDGQIEWGPPGPSLRDMTVQPKKNTRLSAALYFRPDFIKCKGIRCRICHNPWAKVRFPSEDFLGARQLFPCGDGSGLKWDGTECLPWDSLSA